MGVDQLKAPVTARAPAPRSLWRRGTARNGAEQGPPAGNGWHRPASECPQVFRSLAAVLGPGALLRAEWGGAGNCASIETALAALGLPALNAACNFATAADTARRLAAAGFVDVDVALVPDPAWLDPGAQLEAYLGTVVLGSVLDARPAAERAGAVRAVAARLPEPTVDYVRLQASARRAG